MFARFADPWLDPFGGQRQARQEQQQAPSRAQQQQSYVQPFDVDEEPDAFVLCTDVSAARIAAGNPCCC